MFVLLRDTFRACKRKSQKTRVQSYCFSFPGVVIYYCYCYYIFNVQQNKVKFYAIGDKNVTKNYACAGVWVGRFRYVIFHVKYVNNPRIYTVCSTRACLYSLVAYNNTHSGGTTTATWGRRTPYDNHNITAIIPP